MKPLKKKNIIHHAIVLCTVLVCSLNASATMESSSDSEHATMLHQSESRSWDHAQWIWQKEDGPDNTWVAFRKTFELATSPTQAIASIAVDSKYWLWVNGELVKFEGGRAGAPSMTRPWIRQKQVWTRPAVEKPRNTWYQNVDLTPYLVEGENTLAILVWHWGRETHKGTHIDSGKGGLLFQLDLEEQSIGTDGSWKVLQHPGYDPAGGEIDRNIVQYDVSFDANNPLADWTQEAWTQAGYDASSWSSATEKGTVPSEPWNNLIFDDLPPLKNHGLQHYTNFDEGAFPFVSDGIEIRARLPFNQQITPYLVVESDHGGEQVVITTDNRLNRVDAFYTTRRGKQSFECFSWMNGHEVIYKIPAGVTVLDLKYRWLSVGDIEGSLSISDPDLQRLWDMGANTLMVCARDNFMDCPDRERALWIGDVADQASYLFYVMGPDGRDLLRRAIKSTFLFSENGSFGALGPLRIRELPSQSLQFVFQCVWEYYLNTGDREIIEFSMPYIHEYLTKWQMGEDGLPIYMKGTSPDRWDWVDWGEKETHDKPVIQVTLYYAALEAAQKMADLLGDPEKSLWYGARMATIEAAFDKTYWTGNCYSSSPGSLQDDRANALAILSGLAEPERFKPVIENVLIPNLYCSPHFEWMVNLAMSKAGYTKEAIARMTNRYRIQLDTKWLTTLYENFPVGGSYNHAWNAPNAVIARQIVGIRPIEAGWERFRVTPEILHINELQQVIPTVKGPISINWKRAIGSLTFTLNIPKGSSAQFDVPKDSLPQPVKQISLNGTVVWTPTSQVEIQPVIEETPTRLSLELSSGTWVISVTE